MCKGHCTVAGLWYSKLPGLWFLIPLLQSFLFTTSVIMLENGRYFNHLVRGSCDWFSIQQWDTYFSFPYPSSPAVPVVPVMVWYTIYNAPYTRGHALQGMNHQTSNNWLAFICIYMRNCLLRKGNVMHQASTPPLLAIKASPGYVAYASEEGHFAIILAHVRHQGCVVGV